MSIRRRSNILIWARNNHYKLTRIKHHFNTIQTITRNLTNGWGHLENMSETSAYVHKCFRLFGPLSTCDHNFFQMLGYRLTTARMTTQRDGHLKCLLPLGALRCDRAPQRQIGPRVHDAQRWLPTY